MGFDPARQFRSLDDQTVHDMEFGHGTIPVLTVVSGIVVAAAPGRHAVATLF
jgi:hypothetical protein